MPRQKIELRVVLYDGKRYAVYFNASVSGRNIYTGTGRHKKRDIFRSSYHTFGRTHLKVLGRQVSQGRLPEPDKISDAIRVSSGGGDIGDLNWDYQPKADSKSRRNLILDLRELESLQGGFTAELWALGSNDKDAVENVLKDYRAKAQILAELHIDWTSPALLLFVWTLTPEGWAAANRALRD